MLLYKAAGPCRIWMKEIRLEALGYILAVHYFELF